MGKVKLCELADIYLGVTHTPEYVFDGVPFLSVKDISGGKICFDDCKYISQEEYDSLSEGAKPKVGDMLFCRVGTLGKPIIIPEGTPLFGSFVSLGYLRNKNADRCDLNYLRYWMYSNSFWKQVNSNVKGASQVNLNTGWLSKFDIDLPEMQEQKYRISVLGKCKVIIEQRKEELKVLDNLIKARFVEMFGNPLDSTAKYPIHQVGNVAEAVDPQPSHRTPPVQEGGVPYVSIKDCDYKTGKIDFEGARKVARKVLEEHLNRYTLHDGDFVIGKIGTIGNPVFIPARDDYTLSANVVLVQPNSEVVSPYFLKYSFESDFVERQFSEAKNSTSQAAFGIQKVRNVKVMNPDLDTQRAFEKFVKQVDKLKVVYQGYSQYIA